MAATKKKAMKKPESQAQPAQASAEAAWTGKSQAMFERMLQEVPEAMREIFRGKLMQVLQQKARGGPFAESHVTEIVQELVPEPFKSNILKAFSTLGDFDLKVVEDIITTKPGGPETLIPILHAIRIAAVICPAKPW